MKSVTTGKRLAAAVKVAAGAAATGKEILPILRAVRVTARAGGVTVLGSDLDLWAEGRADGNTSTPGSVLVDGKAFAAATANLGSGLVTLFMDDHHDRLVLKTAAGRMTFEALGPSNDFPTPPCLGDHPGVTFVAAADLRRALKQAGYAVGGEEKAVISGLLVRASGNELIAVGTDGYRLVTATAPAEGPNELEAIVRRRLLRALMPILTANAAGAVEIAAGEGFVRFAFEHLTLGGRTVEGHFPPYKQIIPVAFVHQAEVDRASLLAAVKRAAALGDCTREARIVNVKLTAGALELTAHGNAGDAFETIPARYDGEGLDLAFNGDYLIEALTKTDEPFLAFQANTRLGPAMLVPAGERQGARALLMPLNRV